MPLPYQHVLNGETLSIRMCVLFWLKADKVLNKLIPDCVLKVLRKFSRGYDIKSLNIDNIYNDPYYRSTTPLPHPLPLTPPSHNPNIKPPHPTRDRKTQTSQHQRKNHNTIKRPRIRLSQSHQLVGGRG